MWICVCGETETRIWWREYVYLIMLGYGHDESDPTPDGMFATNFVEFFVCISLVFVDFSWCVRCIIAIRQQCFGKPFAAKWQTVSSRRGRFIVPAYMETPTKWQTEMCVRWCECTYLVMRKCVFDNVRIRARWIGPLRLTECSHPISWVFATLSQTVSSRRGPIYCARIYVFATTLKTIWNAFTERSQHVNYL